MKSNHKIVSRTRKRRLPVGSSLARRANGFTLIELLVVMSLIAILASLAIMFFPNAASSQAEAYAATQVQSWLTIAKQRALRDQAPRGVRLWISTNAYYANYLGGATPLPMVVTDCQYIEQPPDFPGNSGVTMMSGLPLNPVASYAASPLSCIMFMPPAPALPTGSTGILTNGATTLTVPNTGAQVEYWSVQPGDYLEVLGTGLMHQIVQVGIPSQGAPPPTANVDYVVVSPPLPYSVTTTANFRIVRAPRVTGDETLKMPDGTLIDLQTNTTYSNPLPVPNAMDNGTATGFIDILFSPTGEVISPGVANSNINLWVRSPSVDAPTDVFRGAPTIISVFTKTGYVGAFPPNSTIPPGPYNLIH